MNKSFAPLAATDLPRLGEAFEGGFFAGVYLEAGALTALVLPPKAEGESPEPLEWGPQGETAARSLIGGLENTRILAALGHPAASFCADLRIGGKDDWHLPALDRATVLRANFMPDPGYVPAQTVAEAFKAGGPEAFETDDWYWTSTEFSAGSAWLQHFYGGNQTTNGKDCSCRVRAVRKVRL